jgi:hypothetical protein
MTPLPPLLRPAAQLPAQGPGGGAADGRAGRACAAGNTKESNVRWVTAVQAFEAAMVHGEAWVTDMAIDADAGGLGDVGVDGGAGAAEEESM